MDWIGIVGRPILVPEPYVWHSFSRTFPPFLLYLWWKNENHNRSHVITVHSPGDCDKYDITLLLAGNEAILSLLKPLQNRILFKKKKKNFTQDQKTRTLTIACRKCKKKKKKKITCYLWVELAGHMIEFHPGQKRAAAADLDHNTSTDTFICGETYAHHGLLIYVPNCHFVQSTFLSPLFSLCRGSFPKIYSVYDRKLIWH